MARAYQQQTPYLAADWSYVLSGTSAGTQVLAVKTGVKAKPMPLSYTETLNILKGDKSSEFASIVQMSGDFKNFLADWATVVYDKFKKYEPDLEPPVGA
jgi:hypothetical protein